MARKQCSGIINLLFDGFTDNTRGHFTCCSHTRQLVKYPRVLSGKPSNKVYILHAKKPRRVPLRDCIIGNDDSKFKGLNSK